METDVKGQLGGLEASEAVRRRLAAESAAWRCGGCSGGKTNREIMEECEERARELGLAEKERGEEEKVPEELKMEWRDEMEKKEKEKEVDDEESARLAEGFVQTAPTAAASGQAHAGGMHTLRPERGPAPATRTLPAANPPQMAPGPALQQLERRTHDEVPVWLDQLILGIAILLAAVVAKVMFV
ncbi:hypothetical protein VTI74DRAFT_2597 [Chaetomium olivicolor]